MSVWLITIQLIVLQPVLDEPRIQFATTAIMKDEATCDTVAKQAHKELGALGTVVTSCELVKIGTPVERKRGGKA